MRAKWGGVTLGPSMTGKLIPVAWPNGDSVVSSLRLARTKTNPPEYSGGAKMVRINEGTYVNSTHWTYTFLCKGCITGSSLSFSASSANARLGWGISSTIVGNPGSSTARLGMHQAGTGTFNIDLSGAKHAKYGAWAEMAK
jgi:cellobiose dehydrogenase (acceptor)